MGWPSHVTTPRCGTSRSLKVLNLYLYLQVVEQILVKIGGRDRILFNSLTFECLDVGNVSLLLWPWPDPYKEPEEVGLKFSVLSLVRIFVW